MSHRILYSLLLKNLLMSQKTVISGRLLFTSISRFLSVDFQGLWARSFLKSMVDKSLTLIYYSDFISEC